MNIVYRASKDGFLNNLLFTSEQPNCSKQLINIRDMSLLHR